MGVKNMDHTEVTLFYKKQDFRDEDGVQREKIIMDRSCQVKFDDGEILFGTVQILVAEAPLESDGGVVSFFLENRDARDDGTGSVLHQHHSSEV